MEFHMEIIPSGIKRLFWDVEKEGVKIQAHRFYIIKRVMDYGNMANVQWMMRTYTADEIREVLKKSRGLSRKSAHYWATYFQVPIKEVECLKAFSLIKLRPF